MGILNSAAADNSRWRFIYNEDCNRIFGSYEGNEVEGFFVFSQ